MIIGETKIKAHLEAPFESYIVDTSLDEFDYDAAWHYLSTEAYWARYRTREFFEMQVRTAFMIIGLFHIKDGHKKMIGSARVTGDGDTMMLNDVYILKEHQGTGLGVKFLNSVLFGGGRDIWRWLLYTGDRKDWYVTKFGFKVLGNAARSKMVNTPIVVLERDGRTLKFDQEQEQSKTS